MFRLDTNLYFTYNAIYPVATIRSQSFSSSAKLLNVIVKRKYYILEHIFVKCW